MKVDEVTERHGTPDLKVWTMYYEISNITDDNYLFTIGSIIPNYFVEHLEKTVGNYKDLL